mmetsp:Transcript_72964/g.205554  ORF Transcript_72964/g.205554 Transcript_72964/m.205554 type:complete len:311 (+) Transcript_72964:259-1191(+)
MLVLLAPCSTAAAATGTESKAACRGGRGGLATAAAAGPQLWRRACPAQPRRRRLRWPRWRWAAVARRPDQGSQLRWLRCTQRHPRLTRERVVIDSQRSLQAALEADRAPGATDVEGARGMGPSHLAAVLLLAGTAEGAAAAAAEAAEAKAKAAPTYSVSAAAYIAPIFRWGSVLPADPAPAAPTVDEASSALEEEEELRPPADASCAWHCVSTIRGEHPRPIYSIEWLGSPTGWSGRSSIATACGDNHVRVFQPLGSSPTSDWACVADVEAHSGDANCVAWYPAAAPDGAALLASCGDDGDVVVWRFAAA